MSESDGTAPATGSDGLSEMDAASRIEALLAGSGDSDGDEAKRKPPEASSDEDDDAPEGEEDPVESEEDEETEEEAPEPRAFTVKVDGEDVTVTEDELLRGYSRTQDYTRKTMELAEARKALEPELEALREERAQYANLLPQLFNHLQRNLQAPDLEHLRQTDPGEWAARMREHEHQENAIRQEYQRVTAQQEAEEQRQRAEDGKREVQALLSADRDFAKPGVFEEVKAYGLQLGFTGDDLDQNLDHKAWITLRKAMEYDRLKAKAPETKVKVQAVKTAAPGSKGGQPSKVTELTRAKQRLAKTGRVEDAALAIERMLGQ